jgi:VWFA-related protein
MTRKGSSLSPRLIVLSFLFASQVGLATAQEPANKRSDQDQSVRLKTELVELRAVVTDKKGNPISNLKKEDFEVLENGVQQEIGFFSLEMVQSRPVAPRAKDTTPPPGPVPAGPSTTPAPARTIVLFVDTLHLSTFSFLRAKQQLKQFVDEQITDQDLVAVVTTSSSLGVLQQFMQNRKMLKYAIDKITLFATSDSLFTPYIAAKVSSNDSGALSAATQILMAEEGGPPPPPEGYVRARASDIVAQESNTRRATLLTLRAVCDRMAEMPGQRMIAFVSDGFTMLDDGGGSDNQDLISVTGRASRSGVVIYSFDAKGLEVPAEYQASVAITGAALRAGGVSRYVSDSKLDQQSNLRTLAYDTGGEAYVNRNFLNKWLQAMLDSNRVYYAISYYPAENKDKKKFRNVTIRVKDHPDYVVRAQKGYFAAEEKKTDVADTPRQKLFQAMLSPLPVTSIPIIASAEFLRREGDDTQVSLQVHVDGDALQYQKQGESFLVDGEVVTTIFDRTGKLTDTIAQSLKVTLSGEQARRARREGFRYNKRLALKPDFYQLRVGVRDVASNLMGTSMCWVEVPDLEKSKVALSSLFLGREGKSQERTETPAGQDKQIAGPAFIIGRASFKSGDTAYYRFVAYTAHASGETDTPATIKVEIIDGEKVVYQGGWQPLTERTIRKDAEGIEAGGRLQLGLAPGFYSLRVTLKDPKSKKTVHQTADFEVEP